MSEQIDKKSKKRGGFYWIDGKPYVSVTQVLRAIDKPSLRFWYGKMVYYALVKDPSLSEQDALSAPYQEMRRAASRGSTIHSLIEALKNGNKLESVPQKFEGYKNAFEKWRKDFNPQIIEHEKVIVNKEERYAGTLDMLAKIGGKLYVIDFKTSKSGETYIEAELQVAAYLKALGEATDTMIVGLSEKGKYTVKNIANIDETYKAFLATKQLWEYLNRDTLEKINYYGRR